MGHLEWQDDSFRVFFGSMKNDTCGTDSNQARHIFANPVEPVMCPVLSLALYFLAFGVALPKANETEDNVPLFPGASQYNRYTKQLKKVLKDNHDEVTKIGIVPKYVCTHSFRKGATTYASIGSTACPSSASIQIRGGWSMGQIQNRYYKYEAAGDRYVGRILSGLPLMSEKFSMLPPHFHGEDELVQLWLPKIFCNVPSRLDFLKQHCLASLAFHVSFLENNLHPTH